MKKPDRVVTDEGVVWSLVTEKRAQEPARVGSAEVSVSVNVEVYSYRMFCGCGRVRYAQPKSLHEVRQCRVCATETRAAKKRRRPEVTDAK